MQAHNIKNRGITGIIFLIVLGLLLGAIAYWHPRNNKTSILSPTATGSISNALDPNWIPSTPPLVNTQGWTRFEAKAGGYANEGFSILCPEKPRDQETCLSVYPTSFVTATTTLKGYATAVWKANYLDPNPYIKANHRVSSLEEITLDGRSAYRFFADGSLDYNATYGSGTTLNAPQAITLTANDNGVIYWIDYPANDAQAYTEYTTIQIDNSFTPLDVRKFWESLVMPD